MKNRGVAVAQSDFLYGFLSGISIQLDTIDELLNNFNKLCVSATSRHSAFIFSRLRRKNCRKPLQCLIWPNGGSAIPFRRAYSAFPFFVLNFRAIFSLMLSPAGLRPLGSGGTRSLCFSRAVAMYASSTRSCCSRAFILVSLK